MVQPCNPSSREAEAGGWGVGACLEYMVETLSQQSTHQRFEAPSIWFSILKRDSLTLCFDESP